MTGATTADTQEPGTALAMTDKTQLELFASMVTLIPGESEDDWTSIFRQILDAERWDQLNTPWEASKVAEIAGETLIINSAKRRPSDFSDGLGFFLVLDCTVRRTGEQLTIVTGSVAVVAQIVKAYSMGLMPLVVQFVVAKRKTKKGYNPHHLHVVGTLASPHADAADHEAAEA